jgi:hypothetical protein
MIIIWLKQNNGGKSITQYLYNLLPTQGKPARKSGQIGVLRIEQKHSV